MKRLLARFQKIRRGDCQYCRSLYTGDLQLPASELIRGVLCCLACQLLYQSINPFDLADPRLELAYVCLRADSQVSQIFDPQSAEIGRRLCAEEGNFEELSMLICKRAIQLIMMLLGFSRGGWFEGPLYPLGASYPPVERTVELFALNRKLVYYRVLARCCIGQPESA